MIKGKRVLSVVPARGGSKGIPLKNLRTFNGTPMVALVGEIVREVPNIDRTVVSTDHEEIARVAEEAGIAAPFRRPKALSGDRIGDIDVLIHALKEMENLDGHEYEIVVMLQPTSPMRRPEHVSATIDALVAGNWDAAWTVSETDSKGHPLKQLTVDSGLMTYYDPLGGDIIARQQLNPVYHRNGIAYAFTRSCLLDQKTIKGTRTHAVILDGEFISIDTQMDITLAEFLVNQQQN